MTPEIHAAWLDPLHEGFMEALRSNNLDALGNFYTEDAVLLPPGRKLIVSIGAEGRRVSTNPTKYVAIWLKIDSGWKIDSMAWNSTGANKRARGQRVGGRRGRGKQMGTGGNGRQGAGRG